MAIFFDLSQPLEPDMTIFPGDPKPIFSPATGAMKPWRVTDLHLGTHSGTHVDSASHYLAEGKTIDQYPLTRFIVPGIVVPTAGLFDDQEISEELIVDGLKELPKGGAVLIRTEWDQYWKTDRYLRHPYLSTGATLQLAEAGAGLVGIDALNVDSTVQSTDHAHRLLMEEDILIIENLAHLNKLDPGKVYQFSFLPIRLLGVDGSPVRAVAWQS